LLKLDESLMPELRHSFGELGRLLKNPASGNRCFPPFHDYVKMICGCDSVTTKFEFLANHEVFSGLSDEQLLALSQLAQEYAFNQKSVLAYQRDVADGMVLVRDGRLYARAINDQGVTRADENRHYDAGDYFGAEWLFDVGTHPATVFGSVNGHVLILRGADFRQFLRAYPDAIQRLKPVLNPDGTYHSGLPLQAWEVADKLPLVERRTRIGPIRLMDDEVVEYYSRRSPIFLLESLLIPAFALVLLPMLAYFLIPDDTLVLQVLRWIAILLPVTLLLILIVLRLLDWRNDYFVITNKHISHREFELRTFRTQLNKVPISQVQSVAVLKPSFTANLFNIGSVRITTASNVGTIVFDGIDDPSEVEDVLNRLSRHVKEMDAAVAQTNMRQSVERHFALDAELQALPGDEDLLANENLLVLEPESGIFESFNRLFDWRIEDGNVITYRRNYLILLREIVPPLLVSFAELVAAALVVAYLGIGGPLFYSAVAILVLVDLMWLLWRYEDWRNDMFQLTDRDVIDIDRKPFGFGESRKQAPLENIQNVRAERPGFFATLFDYGDVFIETAGADANITFDRVPRPSQVLSDIFARLEEYREGQRTRDGDVRRQEYAVLLDVYKQELERGRIPQRLPGRMPPIDE
jgi:uncharacterized membrane protein YdbT with pleckstrin-like domain